MSSAAQKIKFPILQNVDYFDIIKNKTTLKSYSKKEIEGKTWRALCVLVGTQFGAGIFYYNYKQQNIEVVHRGTIRGINNVLSEQKENKKNDLTELEAIKNQITNIGQSNGVSVDLLISITKQSYELQINFLNTELQRKENVINKLEKQIDDLNNELSLADEQIEELKSKTGINQYLGMAQEFLKIKTKGAASLVTLKDGNNYSSNPDDIPKEILNILGAVDWSKVSPEILNTIIAYLNMYINKLPLK